MSSRFQSKSPSVIGAISRHHNGWRVAFKFGGRTTSGPIRTHKSDAELDLERARAARTHQEYSDILHVLRKTAESQRKINKEATMVIGNIRRHSNGWRAEAKLMGTKINGPTRKTIQAADADLKRARASHTRQEYRRVLGLLRKKAMTQRAWEDRRVISRLGAVTRWRDGCRVTYAYGGQAAYGPYRSHRAEALNDLRRARTAKSREEFRSVLVQLKRRARQIHARRSTRQVRLKTDESRQPLAHTEITEEPRCRIEKIQREEIGDESMKRRSDDQQDTRPWQRACVEVTAGGERLTRTSAKSDEAEEKQQPTKENQEALLHSEMKKIETTNPEVIEHDATAVDNSRSDRDYILIRLEKTHTGWKVVATGHDNNC